MDLPARFTEIHDALFESCLLIQRTDAEVCEHGVEGGPQGRFIMSSLGVYVWHRQKKLLSIPTCVWQNRDVYKVTDGERGWGGGPESLALLDGTCGLQTTWLEMGSIPLQWDEERLWPGLQKDGLMGDARGSPKYTFLSSLLIHLESVLRHLQQAGSSLMSGVFKPNFY